VPGMSRLRVFLQGIGYFLSGLRWVVAHPRWWLFGLIPALITLVIYVVALVLLSDRAGDLATFLTPFADGWSDGARNTLRTLLGVVIFLVGLVIAVLTFTAVALTVGDPFYEKLSEKVEESQGGLPEAPDVPLWRSIARSARDSLITLGYVLLFTVPLFVLGFVPVVGQTVVPVLGAAVSGFFLTVELTALALERRGLARLPDPARRGRRHARRRGRSRLDGPRRARHHRHGVRPASRAGPRFGYGTAAQGDARRRAGYGSRTLRPHLGASRSRPTASRPASRPASSRMARATRGRPRAPTRRS
jgi:CysZ protein